MDSPEYEGLTNQNEQTIERRGGYRPGAGRKSNVEEAMRSGVLNDTWKAHKEYIGEVLRLWYEGKLTIDRFKELLSPLGSALVKSMTDKQSISMVQASITMNQAQLDSLTNDSHHNMLIRKGLEEEV